MPVLSLSDGECADAMRLMGGLWGPPHARRSRRWTTAGGGTRRLDPDLPPELRAALQAERREQQQQQQQPFYRPYGGGFSGGHLWHSHECKPGKMLL